MFQTRCKQLHVKQRTIYKTNFRDIFKMIWASSWENLSSVFATSWDSNQPAQLQRLVSLEISTIARRGIILCRQRTTKVLIRLRGCAGWSTPLLFAYGINRFSLDVPQIYYCSYFFTNALESYPFIKQDMFSILLIINKIFFLQVNVMKPWPLCFWLNSQLP